MVNLWGRKGRAGLETNITRDSKVTRALHLSSLSSPLSQLSSLPSQLKGRVGKMYQTEQLAAPEAHVLVVQTPGGGERCFPTNSSLQNLET